jgi:hypothetical protein
VKQYSNIYKIFFSALLFVIAASINLNAIEQEKEKSTVNEKIKSIKGDVTRIAVTADGKETVFDGEEAQLLFKKLMLESKMRVRVMTLDDDDNFFYMDEDERVMIFKGDDHKDIKVFMKKSNNVLEWISKGDKKVKKEINVEIKDGRKKVTITTTEDGEKKVEVLEGEPAEKFLKEHEKKYKCDIKFEKDGKEIKIFKKRIEKE